VREGTGGVGIGNGGDDIDGAGTGNGGGDILGSIGDG
jgi:hypothetical protein